MRRLARDAKQLPECKLCRNSSNLLGACTCRRSKHIPRHRIGLLKSCEDTYRSNLFSRVKLKMFEEFTPSLVIFQDHSFGVIVSIDLWYLTPIVFWHVATKCYDKEEVLAILFLSFNLQLQLSFPTPRRSARFDSFVFDLVLDLNTSRRDSYLNGKALTFNCFVVGGSFGEWKVWLSTLRGFVLLFGVSVSFSATVVILLRLVKDSLRYYGVKGEVCLFGEPSSTLKGLSVMKLRPVS